MRVIHDFGEFYKLVKPLRFDDFDGLGIIPSTKLGVFFPSRLQDLLEFCKKNPKYHIISALAYGVEVNGPTENVSTYELGQGDSDPELMWVEKMDWEGYECLKILKFNVSQPGTK